MIIVPTCLKGNEIAIIWFKKHAKLLNLLPEQIESFALVAEIYSSWRNSTNTQDKKTFGDQYFRFAKEFNLLPRSAKKKEAKQANQIGNYFNK